jgi:hypothetical protein
MMTDDPQSVTVGLEAGPVVLIICSAIVIFCVHMHCFYQQPYHDNNDLVIMYAAGTIYFQSYCVPIKSSAGLLVSTSLNLQVPPRQRPIPLCCHVAVFSRQPSSWGDHAVDTAHPLGDDCHVHRHQHVLQGQPPHRIRLHATRTRTKPEVRTGRPLFVAKVTSIV